MSDDQQINRHLRRQKELDLRQIENEFERARDKRQQTENRSVDLKRQIARLEGEYYDLLKDLKKAGEEEQDIKAELDKIRRELSRM